MPSGIVAGYFDYPSLPPLIAGEYTCSHGVTPGTIVLRVHPSPVAPFAGGAVTIGDGRKALLVRGCKLIRYTAERSDAGEEWVMELEDGRWRWRDGRIDGQYNQLDTHGKLIPRTIKSPTELAHLCLNAMGVQRRIVDMPDGIPGTAFINNIPDFLPVGINFPPLGINPPVNWFAANPAQSLAALADQCGRRVVYDPIDDRVLIVRPGLGDSLPDGHIHNITPALNAPETPDAVQVVGDPTRFEMMLELYAVGIEWDGSIRPIDQLSYAPVIPGRQHIVHYTVTKLLAPGAVYGFTLESDGAKKGVTFSYSSQIGDTISDVVTALKNLVRDCNDPSIKGKIGAAATVDKVVMVGANNGLFDAIIYTADGREAVTINQAGAKDKKGWDYSQPPTFGNVKATDRLTRLQAIALAQRCIFRMYRLTGRDASTLVAPIYVPNVGPVVRQDLIISEVCCDQVVPDPGDKRFVDKDGKPLIRNLYDGYSRDKPAEVYGSVCTTCATSGNGDWFFGSGTVNEGAAKLGGLAAPEQRVMSFEIRRVDTVSGSSYNVTIAAPGGSGVQFSYIAIPGDTSAVILTALKTAIDATTDATLKGKLTVALIVDKMLISGAPGFLFEMTTGTGPDVAAVGTLKTGSGDPKPAAAVVPADTFVSPSELMTPDGDKKGTSFNTDPSDRVYVDFHVDATWQTITFSQPVWYAGPGLTIQEPKLFLRCACLVKNAATQQTLAYSDTKVFRAGPAVHIERHPDIQLNVIGDYRIAPMKGAPPGPGGAQYVWQLKNTRLLEADAVLRARYYLIAALLQYQLKGGLTVVYNGIEPVRMDGKTMQVTYKVEGGSGTSTTASTNMEHSTWVYPYPARRRAENLNAVARNAAAGGRVDNPGGNPGSQNPNPGG